MNEKFIFKPRARLLLQLGDHLIKNESIALLELVKNSYDADAKEVKISMTNVDNPKQGTISIEDNGSGMNLNIIRKVWMEPGSDFKVQLYLDKIRTPKYKRLPLGEKGIGRFSVHKLGNEIELVSKTENDKEICININWNRFKENQYLEEIPIKILEREEPEIFKNGSIGTKIIIKNLRTTWTRSMVREVHRAINALCSPFDAPDSFKVILKTDNHEWIKDLNTWEDFKEDKLFKVYCELEGSEIVAFRYEFCPWPVMTKLQSRIITEKDDIVALRKRMVYSDTNEIDLSLCKIGKLKFEAYIYDLETKLLALGHQNRKGLRGYLNSNGGIRVYRDGVRVYDYGEPGNDWLNLGGRRVNVPAKRLSNNLIIGAIHLSRDNSSDLIEKTNREGFIENKAYHLFYNAILYALKIIEDLRNADKDKLREFYGPTAASEPVISSINNLMEIVGKRIDDEKLREEVDTYLTKIEDNYKTINETLLKGAGAGLSLSVAIHEIEKISAELKHAIKKEKMPKRLVTLIKHLARIVDSYGDLVRNSSKEKENLVELIEQAMFNVELRFDSHKVKLITDYSRIEDYKNATIACQSNFVIGVIMNIVDNSLWWMDYSRIEKKKLFISVSDQIEGYRCIIIADNGPGFALPTEEIIKPFVSGKPDGMGLGLHISKEVMRMQGGELLFPSYDEFSIPEEFKNGAIIALAFKKEKGE